MKEFEKIKEFLVFVQNKYGYYINLRVDKNNNLFLVKSMAIPYEPDDEEDLDLEQEYSEFINKA